MLVEFTTRTGETVWVNPVQVRLVVEEDWEGRGAGKTAVIVLGSGNWNFAADVEPRIVVPLPARKVVEMLDNATPGLM